MTQESTQGLPKRLPERARPKKATGPRRIYSLSKKLQVVRETLAPGASVSVVARRHDINSNVVFRWRAEHMRGELMKDRAGQGKAEPQPAFQQVGELGQPEPLALPAPQEKPDAETREQSHGDSPGTIEIETPLGTKMRLTGKVDERTVRLVLAEMRRRR